MSRLFSSSTHQLEKLKWKLNSTTVDVDWAQSYIDQAVNVVPGLGARVDSDVIK